jgi:hypothetical protein
VATTKTIETMIEVPEVAARVVVDIAGGEVEEVAEVILVAVGAVWERDRDSKAGQEGKILMLMSIVCIEVNLVNL